ncbi:uncharacterized protein ALTATR162_LOCUS7121 [Alternaria atra]|uniref:Uncharacterized protein n=1 Tax=Alternaria atra TaxID=119953 RepID=A0A8J2N7B5_9PLEO|nr:uncharacterized protein ALTATR162_LOCUS7121 [Alternaria atra]CAG5170043.1 unnamed protein product [Alternaria atra]
MRLNAIILVITGLLAFASAKYYGKDNRSPCEKQGCFLPTQNCVKACDRGTQCQEYCECYTQEDPMPECRTNGCLSAPQGCEKFNTKRGLDFKHGINLKRDTDQVAPDYADQAAPKNIDYNKDALEYDNATAKADDNTCVAQGCDAGLPYCLEQCGSGPHCEGYCACYLHSNLKSICRQQGCVEAPQDCDKWEFTERDTAHSGPETAEFDSIATGDQQSPPIDHCQVCRAAIYTCQQNCRGDKPCEATCNCPVTEWDSCHKCASTSCSTTIQVATSDDVTADSPPIDHCQVCRAAVYACQQNCNGDQACKASCLCPRTERDSCGKCQSADCPST